MTFWDYFDDVKRTLDKISEQAEDINSHIHAEYAKRQLEKAEHLISGSIVERIEAERKERRDDK